MRAATGIGERFSPGHVSKRRRQYWPMVFIGGTRSNEVRQVGMRATQRLTHGQVSWIDGSHLFPLEKPAETAAEVLRWLTLFSAPSTLGARATPHL